MENTNSIIIWEGSDGVTYAVSAFMNPSIKSDGSVLEIYD